MAAPRARSSCGTRAATPRRCCARTFDVAAKPIASARLYVTARGIYEVFLNGTRVGDDHYNPGLTQYNVTHFYQTYDVTPLVRPGRRTRSARCSSEGWWSGLLSFGAIWNHFGDRQSLLAKLVVTLRRRHVGHRHDQRPHLEVLRQRPRRLRQPRLRRGLRHRAGAGRRGLDDRGVRRPARGSPPSEVPIEGTTFSRRGRRPSAAGRRRRSRSTGCRWSDRSATRPRVFRTLTARSVKEVRPGVFVYDLGQNIVGVPRITIANGRAGSRSHAAIRRDALSGLARVGQQRRHDHDGELPRSAQPGRLHDEGGPAGLPAALHLARVPVRRDHRDRRAHCPTDGGRGRRDQFGAHADGRLPHVERQGEPALVEPGLVQRRQLPHPAHRLSAAQRTHGLVRRHQRLLAHGDLRLQRRPVPDAAHVRDARRPAGRRPVRRHRAGGRRLRWRPLGQRRHRRAVGGLPPVQRRGAARAALSGDDRLRRLPRVHARPEDGFERPTACSATGWGRRTRFSARRSS